MTQHDVRAFLLDIEQACSAIVEFTAGKTLAVYLADAMLRSAVERKFEIIGEALNRALALEPSLAARVTDTRSIIAFRNSWLTAMRRFQMKLCGAWSRASCRPSDARSRCSSVTPGPDTHAPWHRRDMDGARVPGIAITQFLGPSVARDPQLRRNCQEW